MRNPRKTAAVIVHLVALLLLCETCWSAERPVDWVILIDNTGTMRHQGRGEMTIEGIREFVGLVNEGDRVSVVSYGESPSTILPVNPVLIDGNASREHIRDNLAFAFDADRTDITAGLDYVWQARGRLLAGQPATAADGRGGAAASVVVLLTDGKLIPVYDDYANYDEVYGRSRKRLEQLADLCAKEGVVVCTVGLGRNDKIDERLLAEIASKTGGTYSHAEKADDLAGIWRSIARDWGHQPVPGAVQESAATKGAASRRTALLLTDTALAGEQRPNAQASDGEPAGAEAREAAESFPADLLLSVAGVLGAFVGLVAMGNERRQRWAARFSAALFGTGEQRVRGYLKPIDPPGTFTARVNIGLENPGLDVVEVGRRTPFLSEANALVRFVGTTDGSPPELHVEDGNVLVEGEPAVIRKLRDGDVIDIDTQRYQYLRGNRR